MSTHDLPHKTLFFVCCSTVAAIIATEVGPLNNSDSYAAYQSYDAFVDEYESYLENNKVHPWCGFGRMDDVEVGYLAPDGDGGVRLINQEEYEKLLAETPGEA